jgi:hypothetical protein
VPTGRSCAEMSGQHNMQGGDIKVTLPGDQFTTRVEDGRGQTSLVSDLYDSLPAILYKTIQISRPAYVICFKDRCMSFHRTSLLSGSPGTRLSTTKFVSVCPVKQLGHYISASCCHKDPNNNIIFQHPVSIRILTITLYFNILFQ